MWSAQQALYAARPCKLKCRHTGGWRQGDRATAAHAMASTVRTASFAAALLGARNPGLTWRLTPRQASLVDDISGFEYANFVFKWRNAYRCSTGQTRQAQRNGSLRRLASGLSPTQLSAQSA